jgi:16S rRNA (guanine527-N7)-methyltransferase
MRDRERFQTYTALVEQYSRVLDLTSPKLLADFQSGIELSLEYLPYLPEDGSVLDVGSGNGLPGIPLAIERPQLQFSLCEIRSKRAAFLDRAVSLLKLSNVSVHNTDASRILGLYSTVIALRVAKLEKLYALTQHCLTPSWKMIVRKGEEYQQELAALGKVANVVKFHVKHSTDGGYVLEIEGQT